MKLSSSFFFSPASDGSAGAVGVDGDVGQPGEPGEGTAGNPLTLTITPELLVALGIPGDQATPESVANAITAQCEKAANADEALRQLTECRAQLAAAQKQLDDAAAAAAAEELAEQLSEYDLDEPTTAALTAMAPEHRTAMLAKMPKKAAPAGEAAPANDGAKPSPGEAAKPGKGTPPPPIHDPSKPAEPSAADKAAASEKLIAEIRKEPGTKFPDYTTAREEARRRKPELFA